MSHQPPFMYVQQPRRSGCAQLLIWLLVALAVMVLCCLGQTLLGWASNLR